jgi:hypothetical protein
MNIVLILNESNSTEWVSMEKCGSWYIVCHYVGNMLKRKCRFDDFFEAVKCLKEWNSYFE